MYLSLFALLIAALTSPEIEAADAPSDRISVYFHNPTTRSKQMRTQTAVFTVPSHFSIKLYIDPPQVAHDEGAEDGVKQSDTIVMKQMKHAIGLKYGPQLGALQRRLLKDLFTSKPSPQHALLCSLSYTLNTNHIINTLLKDPIVDPLCSARLKACLLRNMAVVADCNGRELSVRQLCLHSVVVVPSMFHVADSVTGDDFVVPLEVLEGILSHLDIIYRVVLKLVAKRFAKIDTTDCYLN